MAERKVEFQEFWREPDRNLKLNSIQKHIISFARKHQGIFTFSDYERHLSDTVENAKQRGFLLTRKNNACSLLVKSGYLIEKHRGEFKVNPLVLREISELKRKEPFEIKDNHTELLMKNKEGFIIKSEVKKEHTTKNDKERLEVDIQYDERTIRDKVEKIFLGGGINQTGKNNTTASRKTVNSFAWYCNKASQLAKVAKVLNDIFKESKSKILPKQITWNFFLLTKKVRFILTDGGNLK